MYIYAFFDISIEMKYFELFIFYVYLWFVSIVPRYGFWIAKQVNGKIYYFLKIIYLFFKIFFKLFNKNINLLKQICRSDSLLHQPNCCNMWNLLQWNLVLHKPIASDIITMAYIYFFVIAITPYYNDFSCYCNDSFRCNKPFFL